MSGERTAVSGAVPGDRTAVSARGSAAMTLRARKPGYAVMQKCLEIQAAAGPRSRWQQLWGSDPLAPEARSWFKGALGERLVAAELETLGDDFLVLHAVPIGSGSSDVDHVVVGPTGVFTINTKNHAERRVWAGGHTLSVEGQKQPHIQRSLREGEKASAALSQAAGGPIPVRPLLVVVAENLSFGKKAPAVPVLAPTQVGRFIGERPREHSDEAARYLGMLAEERQTWHAEAVVLDDTLRHVQRFERLEQEIADARRQRGFMRRAARVAVLAVPAGGVLGFWWGVAVSMF
jgi:hypothetical protein